MNKFLLPLILVFSSLSLIGQTQGSFTIQIVPAPSITTTSLPGGEIGLAYNAQIVASGGIPPYTFSLLTASPFGVCGAGPFGPLPAGLSMSTSGVISGTPTATGTFPICVQVKDSMGGIAAKKYGSEKLNPIHKSAFRRIASTINRKRLSVRSTLSKVHIDEASELGMVVVGAAALLKH